MISKEDFLKINNYLWQIPKSFREDMRVPARIYSSEKMLEELFHDQSIFQLINGCTLPGIIKYGIAMPDCHEGYSVPIGFVGAIRTSDGVISPGACGFDINCLSPSTKILLNNGAYTTIKDIERSWVNKEVSYLDFQQKNLNSSKIIYFLKRYNNPVIYRITTISGEAIEATGDHPIQTKEGMKEAKLLNEKNWVLIYPFKGVAFREPSDEVILSEEDFKNALLRLGKTKKGSSLQQILKNIKKRNILPLKYNSWQLPYLLKILGFVFGDGYISIFKNKKGVVGFNGKIEDLKTIQEDIKKIGFHSSAISFRKRKHKIKTYYGQCKFEALENSFRVASFDFVALLIALGAPFGLKTRMEYQIPKWIFKCPLWLKRLFLAAFFGAELSQPDTLNKYNFYAPQFSVSKEIDLKENAKLFLTDIVKLLNEFKIRTALIVEVPGYQYQGKRGKTVAFRLEIKEKAENLIKFFATIGYEYNKRKQRNACLAANYLKRKLKIVKIREEARKEIKKLYCQRGDFKKIASLLIKKYNSEYVTLSFLYHSIFKENSHGIIRKRGNSRIAFDFPSFKEYKNQCSYRNEGLIWDRIEKIEKVSYSDFVYDFTISNSNHNFIANNFVVSNCGMRLLKSEYSEKETKPYLDKLATEIQKEVPSGLGRGRQTKLSIGQINKLLEGGAQELLKQGYGEEIDIENCEAQGRLDWADPLAVSQYAKRRGKDQVGTLGSGNHFIEIQKVEKIFDEQIAKVFGLFQNQILIMIHTGSRGLGHQVCTDYLREFIPLMENKYKIKVPDREFACLPFDSPEGQKYFSAMASAANYAWANRQMIAYFIRNSCRLVLGENGGKLLPLYDVAHNIIKKEKHNIDGRETEIIVHRKGATRAFPPGHSEIPEKYREVGQPVLIPGSMGSASYVLAGVKEGKESFFSACHGSGRIMSRHAATKQISGQEVLRNLKSKGIIVKCYSIKGIAQEAPMAYKNINDVIDIVHNAGLSKKVAKLTPLAVIKGE